MAVEVVASELSVESLVEVLAAIQAVVAIRVQSLKQSWLLHVSMKIDGVGLSHDETLQRVVHPLVENQSVVA